MNEYKCVCTYSRDIEGAIDGGNACGESESENECESDSLSVHER
jgi:hypothetical protein